MMTSSFYRTKVLLLSISFVFLSQSASAVLVNRIVASYNKHVITWWEVLREAQIQRIKNGLPLLEKLTQDVLKTMTKKMVVESLVITEADNFKVAYLSKKELATEYEKFKKKFTSEAKFSAFKETYSFSESELKQILTRHLRVESFIKEKILSAYVYLSPEEVRQFMDDHSGWSRKDSEARLRQRRIRQNLKDWIQSLKERHHIKTIWE